MTLAAVDRYVPDRALAVGEHAVVVGASVAGLFAARVLADAYDRVTLVERDELPEGPTTRPGVPQDDHPHLLLEAGRATLEDLFPRFGEAFVRGGGLVCDFARDLDAHVAGGYLAQPASRMPYYSASRPFVEDLIRRRVLDLPEVTLRDGRRCVGYLDEEDGAVGGVVVRDGDATDRLRADLVVDATGRTSRTPQWLADAGYGRPPVEEVHVDIGYATATIPRPPSDRRMPLIFPDPPRGRGGAAYPIERDRWLVLLQGTHGDYPPTEPEGFDAFARTHPADDLVELLEGCDGGPADVHGYRFPSTLRRRYEALDDVPDALVVLGDGLASLNPLYGQGMTVAALEAVVLHHVLARGGDGVGPRFFERVTPVVDAAWRLAVGADFLFEDTVGPKPLGTDLFNRYLWRFLHAAHRDPELSAAYVRVMTMRRPPAHLLAPRRVLRTVRSQVP